MMRMLCDAVPDATIQKPSRLRIRRLGRHLRKTVIRYTLEFEDSATKSYVGLHRESDRRLEKTFSALKLLSSFGFDHNNELRVPSPILYAPNLSFLLMEEAEGKTLRSVLAAREQSESCVSGAGRWLARFHKSGLVFNTKRSHQDGIADSLRYRQAANLLPRLESRIRSVSRALIHAQERMSWPETTVIHGDYHPKNILTSPNSTTVIDFDEAGMGDPAFDLGYFIAQAKMTHGFEHSIDRAVNQLLAEYQNGSHSHDGFERRVKIWEAQTYFQRMYHSYNLLGMEPNYDAISEWLTECEMCLEAAR